MKESEQALPLDGLTVLKLLASPARLRLLLLLDEQGDTPVHDLADALGRSRASVSGELARLRRGHLVEHRRDGQRVLYRLASPALADMLRQACGP